ncbi:MAG: hypothetical protein ACKOAW_04530, partial [Actinomycetota bacterium]
MANSISVAVADIETIRCGSAARVSSPTVTGKAEASEVVVTSTAVVSDVASSPESSPQATRVGTNKKGPAKPTSTERFMMFSLLFSRERLMKHLRQATGLTRFEWSRTSHHLCGTVPESHRTSLTNMHRDYCRSKNDGSR